jgi:hypothetical protein
MAALLAAILTAGCAATPGSRADGCLFGVTQAHDVRRNAFDDPVDAMVTEAIDRGVSFECPSPAAAQRS